MPNVNNPHGLRPEMRGKQGGAPQTNAYTKAAAYAAAIFKWDPVTLLAGVLNGPASGITAGTTRYRGVALNWSPASTLASILVIDEKDAMYEVQEDNSGAANLVAAKMGYNANLAFGTAGGGVTRDNSGVQLSGTSIATTAALDVSIDRLYTDPTNAYGAYGRVEVRFNKFLDNPEVTVT